MEFTTCIAVPALAPSMFFLLVPAAVAAVFWGARGICRGRAEREISAQAVLRLRQYRLPCSTPSLARS